MIALLLAIMSIFPCKIYAYEYYEEQIEIYIDLEATFGYIDIDPHAITITTATAVKGIKWIWRAWRATSLVTSGVQHYQNLTGNLDTSVSMARDHVAGDTYTIDTLQVMLGAEQFWETRSPVQQARLAHVINTALLNGGAVTLSYRDLEFLGIHELDAMIAQRPNFMTVGTDHLPRRVFGSAGFIALLESHGFLEAAAFTVNNYAANNLHRYTDLMIIHFDSRFFPALGATLTPKPAFALVRSRHFQDVWTGEVRTAEQTVGRSVWIGQPGNFLDGVGLIVGPMRNIDYQRAMFDHFLYYDTPFQAGFKYPFRDFDVWDYRDILPRPIWDELWSSLRFTVSAINYYSISNIVHSDIGLVTPFPIELGIPTTNVRTSIFIPDISADFVEGKINIFDNTKAHVFERSLPYTGQSTIDWGDDGPIDLPGDSTYREWLERLEERLALVHGGLGVANAAIDAILENLGLKGLTIDRLADGFELLQEQQRQQALDQEALKGRVGDIEDFQEREYQRAREQERAINQGLDRVVEGQRTQQGLLEGINTRLDDMGHAIIGDFSTINFNSFMDSGGLIERFPFSLPWDFEYVLGSLRAPPEPPRFYFDWRGTFFGEVGLVVVDLAEFQVIASTIRFILSFLFTITLIYMSIKIIK